MTLRNISFFLLSFLLLFTACKEDEANVDNTLRVAFKEFNGTINELSEVEQIDIVASRPAENAIVTTIVVLQDCGGNLSDYIFEAKDGTVITPSTEGAISVSIPSGETATYFTVKSAKAEIPAGAEGMIFNLAGAENAVLNDTHLDFELRIGSDAGFIASDYVQGFDNCGNNSSSADFYIYHSGNKTDRSWGCRSVGNESTTAMVANAFGGDAGTVDAWLISTKKFDFTTATEKAISMQIKSSFDGNGELEVLWSEDFCGAGNPGAANWTNLTALESQFPIKGSNVYDTISTNLSQLLGKTFYLAFRFSGATADNSASYAIDNLKLAKPAEDTGGGTGNSGSSFSTKFEECTEDYSVPAGFILEIVSTKADRSWGCRGFGIDGSRAVQASAFGGDPGELDAWLIIDQSFDFTDLTTVNFLFSVFSNFSGPGEVIVQYSSDYSGSGSPSSASWTAINQINSKMPAAGSKEWIAINEDVTELGGKTVYIAFQFVGANEGASSSWAIDNLAINDPNFTSGGDGGGGTGGGTGNAIVDENFDNSCTSGIPAEWSTYSVSSDKEWVCSGSNRGSTGVEGDYALEMNNYQSADGNPAEDWLVSPSVAITTGAQLSFSSLLRYDGSTMTILTSTNYVPGNNPNDYSWTELTAATNAFDSNTSSWDFIESGNIDLSSLSGDTYIAFKYTSIGAATGESSTARLDNFKVFVP